MRDKIILLVEDDADDETLTLLAFKKGHIQNTVVVVRDGAEALDYLFTTGKHAGRSPDLMPQVVLLDLKLPKIDGLEVLKHIRADERTKTIPVIMLTSSSEEKDLHESYARGVNSYVTKPVDIGQFTTAVQQLGMYWLLLNKTVTS